MEGEFNLAEAANEIIENESSEPQADSSQEDSGDGQSQEDENPAEPSTDPELSAQEILEKLGQPQEAAEVNQEFLEQINKLGAVHKGLPIEVKDEAQLTELLQKGFDYTQKTMGHAEEVKANEEKYSQMETQFQEREAEFTEKEAGLTETINENQIVESILNKLKTEDPDLFQEFADLYNGEAQARQAQAPFKTEFDNQIKELKGVVDGMKAETHGKELDGVKEGWEKDLTSTQEKYAANLGKLGVKADWDKVKDVWGADATGKMSVEDALFAAHGKEIQAANVSHQKMLATKAKTNNALLKRSGMGGSPKGDGGEEKSFRSGDYESFIREASANM